MGKWAEFPTLGYTWSLKEVPLRAAPPRIGRYNEYPPPPLAPGSEWNVKIPVLSSLFKPLAYN